MAIQLSEFSAKIERPLLSAQPAEAFPALNDLDTIVIKNLCEKKVTHMSYKEFPIYYYMLCIKEFKEKATKLLEKEKMNPARYEELEQLTQIALRLVQQHPLSEIEESLLNQEIKKYFGSWGQKISDNMLTLCLLGIFVSFMLGLWVASGAAINYGVLLPLDFVFLKIAAVSFSIAIVSHLTECILRHNAQSSNLSTELSLLKNTISSLKITDNQALEKISKTQLNDEPFQYVPCTRM